MSTAAALVKPDFSPEIVISNLLGYWLTYFNQMKNPDFHSCDAMKESKIIEIKHYLEAFHDYLKKVDRNLFNKYKKHEQLFEQKMKHSFTGEADEKLENYFHAIQSFLNKEFRENYQKIWKKKEMTVSQGNKTKMEEETEILSVPRTPSPSDLSTTSESGSETSESLNYFNPIVYQFDGQHGVPTNAGGFYLKYEGYIMKKCPITWNNHPVYVCERAEQVVYKKNDGPKMDLE